MKIGIASSSQLVRNAVARQVPKTIEIEDILSLEHLRRLTKIPDVIVMEDTLKDSVAMGQLAGKKLGQIPTPDETSMYFIQACKYLREEKGFAGVIYILELSEEPWLTRAKKELVKYQQGDSNLIILEGKDTAQVMDKLRRQFETLAIPT